jgi:hypothetical protein
MLCIKKMLEIIVNHILATMDMLMDALNDSRRTRPFQPCTYLVLVILELPCQEMDINMLTVIAV